MKMELIRLRVLEQDDCDQIRIGQTFNAYKDDIDTVVENTRKMYDDRFAWCGGFDAGCEKYEERIALVDADTLRTVRTLYEKKR